MSDPHLSPDEVADLAEGLLAPERAAAAARHLAGCEECRDVRDALAGVSAMLGALPEAPAPAGVADRLDTALREAAPAPGEHADDDATADGAPAPAGTAEAAQADVVPLAARSRRRPHRRDLGRLGAAAAGLAVVFGAVTVLGDGDTGGRPEGAGLASDSSGERATAGDVTVTASGRAYTGPGLAGAVGDLLGGADGGSVARPEAVAPRVQEDTEPDLRAGTPAPTGRDGAGSAEPSAEADTFAAPGAESAAPSPTSRLADPAALRSCLAGLGRAGARPLAVDQGTFRGRPGVVVVLPAERRPARALDVALVLPSCRDEAPGVRYRTRVPRP